MGRGESLALTLSLKQYRDVTDLDKTKHLNSGLQRVISTIQIDATSTCSTDKCSEITGKDTVDDLWF
jgi:hypothetical protein